MKKTIIWLLAISGMLLATSCLKETVLSQSTGDEVVVSFTTSLRETPKTKAIGDDTGSIDKLDVAVYKVTEGSAETPLVLTQTVTNLNDGAEGTKTAQVTVTLVKGETYRVAFWAQDKDYEAYSFDPATAKVTVDYNKVTANTASADAFFASTDVEVTGAFNKNVTLSRPFAQVNFLTSKSDLDAAAVVGVAPASSSVTVSGVASTFNVLTGVAADKVSEAVTFASQPIKKVADGENEVFESAIIASSPYYYLATAYVLVPTAEAGATEDPKVSAAMTLDTAAPINVGSLTVKRNYRTNVYGDFLTSQGVFAVEVNPGFASPNVEKEYVEVADGVVILETEVVEDTGEVVPTTFGITNANGLRWISQNLNGVQTRANDTYPVADSCEVTLLNDINFSEVEDWDPIGDNRDGSYAAFKGTFDGNNHTIKGIHITGDHCFNGAVFGSKEGWGLFSVVDGATIKNLKIDHATFGSYTVITGTVAGYANNTTFENITITNTKIAGYNWYTGGVVGWAAGECNFVNINLDDSVAVGTLWDSHGQSAGGIAGGVSKSAKITIKNCNVACKMDVINDVTSNYKWYIYRVSGMLIGNTNTTETKYNEVVTATATNVTCENVTVTYGRWMNYHYCEGFWNRGWGRYESSDYVGGVDEDMPHVHPDGEEHLVCIPFDQLFGGSANGSGHEPVKGLAEFPGVTVKYPTEYTCPTCGQQHNVGVTAGGDTTTGDETTATATEE